MVVSPCEQCKGTGRIIPSDKPKNSEEQPRVCPKCGGRGHTTSADNMKKGIIGPIP
jgi:DnaJ-class molecular chaperone